MCRDYNFKAKTYYNDWVSDLARLYKAKTSYYITIIVLIYLKTLQNLMAA